MAGIIEDNKEQRMIDRIRAKTYREAMEEGTTFISRKWIAVKDRSPTIGKKLTHIVLQNLVMEDQKNYRKKVKRL
jgi:hypothetical protein